MGTVSLLPWVKAEDLPTSIGSIEIDPGKVVVAKTAEYPAEEWKNAILYYLKGLWRGAREVTRNPQIKFDQITLRLPASGNYYGYGMFPDPRVPTGFHIKEILAVGAYRLEVQDALAQLLYNDSLKMIHVKLQGDQWFALWKKENGLYGCAGKVARIVI